MTFGLTSAGFNPKRLEDLKAELEEDFKTSFGDITTTPDSTFGILIAELAKPLADLWENDEAVYKAQYPSTAEETSLDDVGEYTGVSRLSATNSLVTAVAAGTEGTILTAGRLISSPTSAEQFTSTQSVTITANAAVSANISVGTVTNSLLYTVTINGVGHDYTSDSDATATEIIAGLVSAIIGGSEPVTATDNGDDTLTIASTDVDTTFTLSVTTELDIDQVSSPMPVQAVNTGPIAAPSGTLTKIITPVSGWAAVTTWVDAVLGRDVETDVAFRLRRAASLQIAGSATVDAIRARLLEIDNVTDAFVIENETDVTDGGGRPPHSFEAVVAGGLDQEIGDIIWEHKPAGVQTYGTETVAVVDSQGNPQTVYFSRATEIYLWVRITITAYAEETFPVDGVTQIEDNALEYGNTHTIGVDVIPQRFIGPTFEVPGIATVLVEIATSATAGGPPGAYQTTNLSIDQTEQAIFDSTRISVVGP